MAAAKAARMVLFSTTVLQSSDARKSVRAGSCDPRFKAIVRPPREPPFQAHPARARRAACRIRDHRASAEAGQATLPPQPFSRAIPLLCSRQGTIADRGAAIRGSGICPSRQAIAGDYDYIIAGAGSAGCLLANRLSADPDKRVLVLEAGGRDNWIWFHIPVGYLFAIGNPRSDWCFKTEPEAGPQWPQPQLSARQGDRRLVRHQCHDLYARPGGRLRSLAAARAFRLGLERRAAVFPASTKIIFSGESDGACGGRRMAGLARRGCAGICSTRSAPRPNRPASNPSPISIAATTKAAAPFTSTRSAAAASRRRGRFLKPVLNRPNLRLETGCLVEGIVFDGKRAAGVRWKQNGQARMARCRGEVILAAGSIGSTQILLLSGVGPAAHLQEHGIPVVLDRPGVGANLQDHLQLRMIYKVDGIDTLNERYHAPLGLARMLAEYALFRRGPLTMAPSQLGLFTRSDSDQERANLQYHVQPLSLDKFGEPLHKFPAFTASVMQSAADEPRHGAAALGQSVRPAGDQAELSVDRRRPPHRRARDQADAAHRSAAGAQAVSSRRISARPCGARRRRAGFDQGRGRYRHHHLSSGRHRENGAWRAIR